MSTVLKVENLSKLYRLGEVGTGTLTHDINRFWHRLRGKDDPYGLVGQTNDRTQKSDSEYVWALKDINFEVKQGEVLGIIGRNGAGKSTLLKIISQITSPSTGSIRAKGRIASLLEVGTGMNPELTARENIYLNGAILGMRKNEIDRKFDEIVDFSGCQLYVDTPIKRFSSGMRVRLGFAVAAFLEPEILIVDEVLAVGDAEFQKKAIGKMKDVSRGEGRTVIFVSHNMTAVMDLCTRALALQNGEISNEGDVENVISSYLNVYRAETFTKNLHTIKKRSGNGKIRFHSIEMLNDQNDVINVSITGQNLKYKIVLELDPNMEYPKVHISMKFTNENDESIFHVSNSVANGEEFKFHKGKQYVEVFCEIYELPLNVGTYYFHLFCSDLNEKFDVLEFAGELVVEAGNFFESGKLPSSKTSPYLVKNKWEMN